MSVSLIERQQRAAREPVAALIRAARIDAGLSQTAVATACGFKAAETVSSWEQCDCLPPIKIAIELCQALGIDRPRYYRIFRRAALAELDARLSHLRPPGVRPRE